MTPAFLFDNRVLMEILGVSTFHNTRVKILNLAETETVELKNVNDPDKFQILASAYGPNIGHGLGGSSQGAQPWQGRRLN